MKRTKAVALIMMLVLFMVMMPQALWTSAAEELREIDITIPAVSTEVSTAEEEPYILYEDENKRTEKGVPYKGFFETLKIYRKLHFQAEKQSDSTRSLIFLLLCRNQLFEKQSLVIDFFRRIWYNDYATQLNIYQETKLYAKWIKE